MLITLSGMVGSGKSTIARELARIFEQDGRRVQQWRFQSLPCFRWFGGASRQQPSAPRSSSPEAPGAMRGVGYRRRRLTAALAAGYAARMVAFRVFLWREGKADDVLICDRYFYDNFAHWQLATRRERLYARLLHWLMPTPDLAIVLRARSEAIAARNPGYAPEYLVNVAAAYERLDTRFQEVTVIETDASAATRARLERLCARFTASGRAR